MKKIILLLMVLFVVSNIGFASNNAKIDKTQTVSPQVKNISIDLGDITSLTNCELSKLISESIGAGLSALPAVQCSITVTAKAKMGIFNIEVSVTMSGDCTEVKAIAAQIANQVIAEVKAYIQANLL